MAEQMNPGVVNDPKHNVGARNAQVQAAFRERFLLEQEVDELTEKHITKVKDKIKALNRKLKKDTDIDGKDLTLFYKVYKRQEMAKTLEEEDRDRIFENLRATFEAIGGQLDFVDALQAANDAQDDDDQPSVAVLEKARRAGRAAGEKGEDGKSPYPEGSPSDIAWLEEWTKAQTANATAMGAPGKTAAA